MKTLTFPESFTSKPHPLPNATQWVITNKLGIPIISVVGGGYGMYGNGITTFEMYDYREEEPQGYMTREEITKYLKENPLKSGKPQLTTSHLLLILLGTALLVTSLFILETMIGFSMMLVIAAIITSIVGVVTVVKKVLK